MDLNVGTDGTVGLTVGTIDVGGARSSLGMIAAEELGISYDDVKVHVADTASLGHNDTTEGSRGTFSSGMATIFAARDAIDVMKQRAAQVLDVRWVDQMENGTASATGSSHDTDSHAEEILKSHKTGGPIMAITTTADGAAWVLPHIFVTWKWTWIPVTRCFVIQSCRTPARQSIRTTWKASSRSGCAGYWLGTDEVSVRRRWPAAN